MIETESTEEYWGEFRFTGDPEFHGEGLLLEIHHGGEFYRESDGNYAYHGGEVHWKECLDPEKLSRLELNYFAWMLGYRNPPVNYWFRHPTSPLFLPISSDREAVSMLEVMTAERKIEVYFVGGGRRQIAKCEAEQGNENFIPIVPHKDFLPNVVQQKLWAHVGQSQSISVEPNAAAGASGERQNKNKGKAKDKDKDKGRDTGKVKAIDKEKGKAKVAVEHVPIEILDDEEEVFGIEAEDEDENARLIDSDYELDDPNDDGLVDDQDEDEHEDGDEDDVDFDLHVDHDVHEEVDMGFTGEISDDSYDSEDLIERVESSGSDDDDLDPKIKRQKAKRRRKGVFGRSWVPERDLRDPKFEVGQVFVCAKDLKEAVYKFSVKTNCNLYFKKNNKKFLEVVCGKRPKPRKDDPNRPPEGLKKDRACKFVLYASRVQVGSPEFVIKTLDLNHTNCPTVPRVRFCTATFLAKHYLSKWKVDPYMSRKLFQQIVKDDFGQNITHKQVIRARMMAMSMNSGSEAEQYNLLESYANMIFETNPRSTVKIQTDGAYTDRVFKRMYICYEACKKGWMEGCRPIIGLDGCHIKGSYPGQLFSAVGIDASNGMFPIAFAIVEAENNDSWKWFIELLISDLFLDECPGRFVFISDKQKGILEALKLLLPEAEHRHCVRHLHNNFKKTYGGVVLKNLLWAAARDTTLPWFETHMKEMGQVEPKAVEWLNNHDHPSSWSRSHFREHTKCDILLNNMCEAFNASILDARDKPILVMLEEMRHNLMKRLNNRRVACQKWKGAIGPRIQKIMNKTSVRSREFNAFRSSDYVFEVIGTSGSILQSNRVVDLRNNNCTCRRWMTSGLPCAHAFAAIYAKGDDPNDYVDVKYKKQAYEAAYAYPIHPIPGIQYWPKLDRPIKPPPYKKQKGRPKRVRIREQGEVPAPNVPGVGKLPRSTYVIHRCTSCGQENHNKRKCPLLVNANGATPSNVTREGSAARPSASTGQGNKRTRAAKRTSAASTQTVPRIVRRYPERSTRATQPTTSSSQPQAHSQANSQVTQATQATQGSQTHYEYLDTPNPVMPNRFNPVTGVWIGRRVKHCAQKKKANKRS